MFNRCCNFTKVTTTSITTSSTNIILQVPQLALNNGQKLRICIAQNIPPSTLPVQIQFQNLPIISLIRRCGTAVISDQLRCNKFYNIIIGTDAKVGVLLNPECLCNTCYTFPQLLPTTPAVTQNNIIK